MVNSVEAWIFDWLQVQITTTTTTTTTLNEEYEIPCKI